MDIKLEDSKISDRRRPSGGHIQRNSTQSSKSGSGLPCGAIIPVFQFPYSSSMSLLCVQLTACSKPKKIGLAISATLG